MKNVGKAFESDFANSVPDYALLYRLPDSAQSFGGTSNLRFSRKNPFDYILWDQSRRNLFGLELKTTSGKSISFEREQGESGKIHIHQVKGLGEWSRYDVICGFVIEFRDFATTVFIDIKDYMKLIAAIDKKSFTLDDLDAHSIDYIMIPQELKRTRYRYDVDSFLHRFKNKNKVSAEEEL